MQDNVTQAASVERELRLDAKAFRENSIWNQDGDEIRLTKTADRLDAAADFIASKSEAVQKLVQALERAIPYIEGMQMEGDMEAFDDLNFAKDILAAHRESQP